MAAMNLGSTGADTPERIVRGATDAAAAGPEHVSEPTDYDAILLAGFGGPEGQDDVIPFLRNVTRGRGIPEERLEEVAHHYRHFGGVSPINDQNRALKAALELELASRGIDLPVLWGNRNWDPYLRDALTRGARARLHASSSRSPRAPTPHTRAAGSTARTSRWPLDETGLQGEIQIDKVRQFFDHPGFVSPFIDGVREAIAEYLREQPEHLRRDGDRGALRDALDPHRRRRALRPRRSAASATDGAYAAQHLAVAEVVMANAVDQLREAGVLGGAVGSGVSVPWQLVYQSRSGPPTHAVARARHQRRDRRAARRRPQGVVIVPLGFVSDHMEVMWDLDNEAIGDGRRARPRPPSASRRRAPPPPTSRGSSTSSSSAATARPSRNDPHMTDLGPWYDVCRPGCCENARLGFKPAFSGIAP